MNKTNKPTRGVTGTSWSRRDLLRAGAGGAALGGLAVALGCSANRAPGEDSNVGRSCMTILYRNGPDVSFDYDYYRDKHLPLIMDRYGASVERFELRRPVVEAGQPAPAYVAAINIWIADPEAFVAAGEAHGQEVAADVANFTNTELVAQNGIIWGEAGAGLHAPEPGQHCLSILYPYEEDASWDADYYRDHHMPLIMDLYGREAIQRIEVRKPQPLPGGEPAFMGTVNIYIEDQEAFDAAGAEHSRTLMADVPNFSSVMPQVIPTRIYGLDTA